MLRHSIQTGRFDFEAGGFIDDLTVVYHTSPREYKPSDKVVWICHALTANSDPEDWWPQLTGPGKLFDTEKYFIVCVNTIGSPYGTTGPASWNPDTGKPYLMSFPQMTIRDMVRGMILVRKHIGIEAVDFLIGSSIGGFHAVEWAVMEPEVIRNAVFMATSARVPAYLTAYNESQRMALEADSTFREQKSRKGGELGLRCARSIALISYRSFAGYKNTQSEPDEDALFAGRACSYQQYQGKKLSDRFDAYSYWYLSRSLDSHNLGRGRGGVAAALKTIKAKTTVVAIDSDCIFPPSELKIMADNIPGASWFMVTSDFGHDGFLLENEQLTKILTPILP